MNKDMESPNKSDENQALRIPKTGKIGNLAKNIENETNRVVVLKVMENVDKFKSVSDRAEKAEWIKESIKRLEQEVGKERSIKIMENCGRDCCRKHARYKKLISKSKPIEEFLDELSTGGFQFRLKDKNTIIGEYDKCYCYQVKQTKKPFPTTTYCQCGAGHIKQLFESALKKPVEVELLQSVITGAESCEFIIHI
uniref:Metanogen output domain-containing protein n=1 Tax=Candidatus Methanophagaceae archaeon ANME-1 ERB6 TaxID=2759912 RepID=A0A7G9Z1E7_9EURY|nr:hypothetical protein GHMFPJCE_00008 [Methanosarcinales archaeon ANME-1 ERB6]